MLVFIVLLEVKLLGLMLIFSKGQSGRGGISGVHHQVQISVVLCDC